MANYGGRRKLHILRVRLVIGEPGTRGTEGEIPRTAVDRRLRNDTLHFTDSDR